MFTSQDACKSVANKVRGISSFTGLRCSLNNANYQLHCSVVTKLQSLGSSLGITQINVFPKLKLSLAFRTAAFQLLVSTLTICELEGWGKGVEKVTSAKLQRSLYERDKEPRHLVRFQTHPLNPGH